jgi:hypothetical protein
MFKFTLFLGVANVAIIFIKTNHNLFILFKLCFLQRIPRKRKTKSTLFISYTTTSNLSTHITTLTKANQADTTLFTSNFITKPCHTFKRIHLSLL